MLFRQKEHLSKRRYALILAGVCLVLLLASSAASAGGYTLTMPGGSSRVYISLNALAPNEQLPWFTMVWPDSGATFRMVMPEDLRALIHRLRQAQPVVPPSEPSENEAPPESPAPAPAPGDGDEAPVPPGNPALTTQEREMFDLVNKERIAAGVKPLKIDSRLVELARMKSKDMVAKNYFSHVSPTYGSPFDMMKKAGIDYRTAGENLAGAPTVERAHTGLMNSPGHKRNILNPAFTHMGIGVAKGGPYGMMFTQMFIGISANE